MTDSDVMIYMFWMIWAGMLSAFIFGMLIWYWRQ